MELSITGFAFSGRFQFIRVSATSSTLHHEHGIPHGSVLGSILFLLCTADLLLIIHPRTFADEWRCRIYGLCSPSEADTLFERLSACRPINEDQLTSHRLQLNPAKTELLHVVSVCSASASDSIRNRRQ